MRLRASTLAVPLLFISALPHGSEAAADAANFTISAQQWLAAPAAVRITSTTDNTIRIALSPTSSATSYTVWASPAKVDLFLANLGSRSAQRRTATSAVPRLSIALPYTTGTVYLRVSSNRGTNRRYTSILQTRLTPPAVTRAKAAVANGAVSVTWMSAGATSYRVAQAANAAMNVNRREYTLLGANAQVTPFGLTRGVRYWFSIRAENGQARSPWSTPVSGVPARSESALRVASFNLLTLTADGRIGGDGAGEVVAPWMTARRPAAAALLRAQRLDVIATQESSNYTGPTWYFPRQVDSLATALGSDYAVAHTQGLPGEPEYVLTGSHIIYRTTVLEPAGEGGHWGLGHGKWAAWQVLRHRASGRPLLVVSTHLTSALTAPIYDSMRRDETRELLRQAQAKAGSLGGIPVIIAGDTGSALEPWHLDDAPSEVMRSRGYADSGQVAQTRVNASYSSVNKYMRRPPRGDGSVDKIFASPGIGVVSWRLALNLTAGSWNGAIPSDHNPVVAEVRFSR